MLLTRRFIAIAALALSVTGSTQQPQAVPPAAPSMAAPQPGFSFAASPQTLTYSVDWRVFTAGQAVFRLENVNGQIRINATADTLGAVNMLYPVADKYQSTFDARTGCSSNYSKQIQEGRRKVNTDLTFNYPAGKQMLFERNLIKGNTKQQETPIPACVTDSLSAIFYVASQPIAVGQSTTLLLADSARVVPVTMKAEAREEIKTPAGTFQTIRMQPTADAGIVKNRGNIWVWYTDDARHIPVQIRAHLPLVFGTITFRLQSAETK
ncbi:DUF3108 domain-containing protein [Terriglobus tenax]|uniref:DUF3108 domain-containing protein n=1 Tax=Terriglobus tenax TaxID=1111115 RepID=UPI0021E0B33A|nr:DUF3108 domain-containing protein [Terriglobus tenax]